MLATVASVSSANRLKVRLSKVYSVNVHIIQTPSSLTKEGCGYSLRFDDKHKKAVAKAASDLKINIRSFFREVNENSETFYIKE